MSNLHGGITCGAFSITGTSWGLGRKLLIGGAAAFTRLGPDALSISATNVLSCDDSRGGVDSRSGGIDGGITPVVLPVVAPNERLLTVEGESDQNDNTL